MNTIVAPGAKLESFPANFNLTEGPWRNTEAFFFPKPNNRITAGSGRQAIASRNPPDGNGMFRTQGKSDCVRHEKTELAIIT
jgi:hypothetical protein